MKSIGIIRRVDDLGRTVIPREIRDRLFIKENDPLEVFTKGDSIILRKYAPGCVFCDDCDEGNQTTFNGKPVCNNCLKLMHDVYIHLEKSLKDNSVDS